MILLALFLLAVVGDFTGVELFVMGVLGVFGTLIVQGIKKFVTSVNIEGLTALNVTMAVSFVLALVGAFATDAFTSVDGGFSIVSVLNGTLVVFGVATAVYKYLLSRDTAVVDTPDTPLT